jgi:hypothetical protein
MEGSTQQYPLVLDLRTQAPVAEGEEALLRGVPRVSPSELANQLKDISDAIAPVLAEAEPSSGFGLQTIELSLTIGAEGGVWFVAKGSAEASIAVTFGRPS